MTGGFSTVNSTVTETVLVLGRASSAGAKVAPASGAGKWTIARASAGVYNITFSESYAEFMGCQLSLEAASGIIRMTSFTAATRVMVVSTFAVDGTTATDKAFAFVAAFSENRAP